MVDSSIPITAGTGTPVRVLTSLGSANAGQQVMTLADQYGNLAPAGPDGAPIISAGPSSLLFDAFDGTLANQWTTGGTAVPTQASGALTFNTGVTVSATSYITSVNGFGHNANSYFQAGWVVQFDTSAALTNSTRWWGYGQNAATPTSAAPITNGVVFMLDATVGTFYAAVYSNGTRTQTVTLTKPVDGAAHRYQIFLRTTRAYFLLDGVTVAMITNPNLAVSNNLFLIAGQANAATAPSATPTFVASVASAADTAGNNQTLSDGTYPSVRATIKKVPTAAPVATDTALVVQALPTVSQASTTLSAVATAVTLTLTAPGAGLRHYITGIWFERYVSIATTAAASGFLGTSGNTNLVFQLPSDAQPIGTVNFPIAINFPSPVASTAQNTATTFSAPAVTGTQYRVSVTYFIAP